MRTKSDRRRNTRLAIRRKAKIINTIKHDPDRIKKAQIHRLAKDNLADVYSVEKKVDVATKKRLDEAEYFEDENGQFSLM